MTIQPNPEAHSALTLYSYWRSSAAFRVRIGLNLKRLTYRQVPIHLLRDGGEQHSPDYRSINPQAQVPVLYHGRRRLRQSLAILEYLDEVWQEPRLLPTNARSRQRVRAIALMIACDVHPLGNLRVLQYLDHELRLAQIERDRWVRHWIVAGLDAVEQLLADDVSTGAFCDGEAPTIADCCLVPQLYSARRFGMDLARYPTLRRIEATCLALPSFVAACPEHQPDAPQASTT